MGKLQAEKLPDATPPLNSNLREKHILLRRSATPFPKELRKSCQRAFAESADFATPRSKVVSTLNFGREKTPQNTSGMSRVGWASRLPSDASCVGHRTSKDHGLEKERPSFPDVPSGTLGKAGETPTLPDAHRPASSFIPISLPRFCICAPAYHDLSFVSSSRPRGSISPAQPDRQKRKRSSRKKCDWSVCERIAPPLPSRRMLRSPNGYGREAWGARSAFQ